MTSNRNTLIAKLAAALLATSSTAFGAGIVTSTLKVNAASANDVAPTKTINGVTYVKYRRDEQTNEQADVKVFPGTNKALYIEMRSSDLFVKGAATATPPPNNVQDACSAINLAQQPDGTVTAAKVQGQDAFVTNNKGNQNRNANQPYLIPLHGADPAAKNAMILTYIVRKNGGNSIRYAKVLDQNCNELPLVDGATGKAVAAGGHVQIMQKDNDDCSMNEDGGGADAVPLPNNAGTRIVMWAGCNGNGEDKGWLNVVDVTPAAAGGGIQVTKKFDVALAQREERSRGRCSVNTDNTTAICTWTEGNNQPQRDGSWIAAVDVAPGGKEGAAVQSRIIWKKLIENQKNAATLNQGNGKTYSDRTKSGRIFTGVNVDGTPAKSDLLFVSTGDLIGNNTNDRKGGRYVDARLGIVQVDRAAAPTAPKWVMPMASILNNLEGFDYTHIKMTAAMVSDPTAAGGVAPVITFVQGSQNGGGLYAPDLKVMGLNMGKINAAVASATTTTGVAASPADNSTLVDYGTHSLTGASYDRHMYSNYLGNNPGVQGRNYSGAQFVGNPFVGQNGNNAKFLLLHALNGKDASTITSAATKTASYVPVTQLETAGPVQKSIRARNGTGGGQYAMLEAPGAAGVTAGQTTTNLLGGGCSVTSSNASGLGILAVLAGLAMLRRRTQKNEVRHEVR